MLNTIIGDLNSKEVESYQLNTPIIEFKKGNK